MTLAGFEDALDHRRLGLSSNLSDAEKRSLARTFDRVWARYYKAGQITLAPEIARTALAARLVEKAKSGVWSEDELEADGFSHLVGLTRGDP